LANYKICFYELSIKEKACSLETGFVPEVARRRGEPTTPLAGKRILNPAVNPVNAAGLTLFS